MIPVGEGMQHTLNSTATYCDHSDHTIMIAS